jgi:hypothetical protein
MKRDWRAARAKVEAEGACRRCGSTQLLDACHAIPRSRVGPPDGEDPLNILVLCRLCHQESHNGTGLDLLPYMTLEEQGHAAKLVGIAEAYQRLGNVRLAA